jgi:hypothetical protein
MFALQCSAFLPSPPSAPVPPQLLSASFINKDIVSIRIEHERIGLAHRGILSLGSRRCFCLAKPLPSSALPSGHLLRLMLSPLDHSLPHRGATTWFPLLLAPLIKVLWYAHSRSPLAIAFSSAPRAIAFPESDSKKDINSCCYSLGAVGFLFTAYIERTQSGSRLEPTLL